MAWRNQGVTGSNNIPLGNKRRLGGGGGGENGDTTAASFDPSPAPPAFVDTKVDTYAKRGRSPVRGSSTNVVLPLKNT